LPGGDADRLIPDRETGADATLAEGWGTVSPKQMVVEGGLAE
jgi:hypothetical protein